MNLALARIDDVPQDVPRRRLWLVPVPDPDPPAFEGSRPESFICPEQPPLPLLYLLPTGLPAEPEPPEPIALLEDPFFAAQPTRTADLPDPVTWTGRLVQGLVDVLSGERPPGQLTRWLTPGVLAAVNAHANASNRADVTVRRLRTRRRIGSIHVSTPTDGVVEACAVIVGTKRSRAMALRLEGLDGRWRCTALDVG